MRCPYCGGLNQDNDAFCKRCGRDLRSQFNTTPRPASAPRPPSYQPPRQVPPAPYGTPRPPVKPVTAPAAQRPSAAPPAAAVKHRASAMPELIPASVVVPESPAPFPPKTVQQLKTLKQGALPFTVVSEDISNRKRIVRIAYPACTGWQQVATLCEALDQQPLDKFETTVIQGVLDQDTSVYAFTNGQMVFDRNVRLGSQILHRYQIETANGFAADALRIVLVE